MTNGVAIERNEIFDIAYRFITETSENVFLTGKAGTGKTTFLKYVKENAIKNIIVAAPTGVAAINAGGVTLHSLFQLPFHPFLPSPGNRMELLGKMKLNRQRQDLLRKMELLVIDEVSMVRCDTLDAIDTILRAVRRNPETAFGGVQLLYIGDLYQLPPVAKREEWGLLQEYYSSPFFFDSMAIKEQMPLLIELTKIYRQNEDSFVALLNKVRNNRMEVEDFDELHQRYIPDFSPPSTEKYITLTSHNRQADQINTSELQKLTGKSYFYEAVIEEEFPESIYPAEATLELRKGSQVMFLKNDIIEKRYFNGKIGVVKALGEEEIIIDCDGVEISVSPETWENSRYTLNTSDGKLEQELIGTFTQFPLRLAWAITIHKSQGLTFEKIMIDAGAAFSSGQVYVALSRCTSLEGIVLLSRIPSQAIYSNENVAVGQRILTAGISLAERFKGARQVYTHQILEEIFSFEEINVLLDELQLKASEQKEKLNSGALPWIREIKERFTVDRAVGLKFLGQVINLMKEEPVIESNPVLQKRIKDASLHFEPRFQQYRQTLQDHPVVTEHREAAGAINDCMNRLFLALYTEIYFLQYCREDFSLTSFLQHKIKFLRPRLNLTIYASGKDHPVADQPNQELFTTLKYWRDKICEKKDLPIYMVANQHTLREIASFLPLTKKDLMQIKGFGKAKTEKYGSEILEAVRDYCSRNNLDSNMSAKTAESKKRD